MATKTETTRLEAATREAGSSRETRRLRREGKVPGVLYGRGQDPVPFTVDARELRHALHGAGAVLELALGGETTPAVLKDSQRHPVRGEIVHVDLLRVDLNKPISSVVSIELVGGEDAPGAKEGGTLEHVTREVTVEALPGDIPETIQHVVTEMEINDTIYVSALSMPSGVTLLDETADETVLATLTPPRLSTEAEDEIETETEVVGEGEGGEDAGEGGEGEQPEAVEESE
jgi:large subunit ribosomal protein L25